MKRFFAAAAITLVCCLLLGCSSFGTGIKEPVTFYYPRSLATYGHEDSIIASELRESSGHTNDPDYLISLYLHGPMDDNLVSPFPQGTSLISLQQEDHILYLTLSDSFANQSSLDISIACACLSKTCFELCNVEQVEIRTASIPLGQTQTVVITKDNIQLHDNSAENVTAPNHTKTED